MTMASSSYKSRFVSCEFDFDAPGKRFGAVQLLFSDNENAGRTHPVPIVVIANGSGSTVLLCAGTHGNEDEGQLVLRRLVQTTRSPGDRVEAGEVAAFLYSLDEVARPPQELVFPAPSLVYARHSTGRVVHGSFVCQTAPEITLGEVRALANA